VFHRILTIKTPIGRKARTAEITKGGPLIRTRSTDLATAGVQRVPKVAGVQNGLPIHGIGRDADRIAGVIDERVRAYSMNAGPGVVDRADAIA
jgi:putative flavoprotein involved in K+ transport